MLEYTLLIAYEVIKNKFGRNSYVRTFGRNSLIEIVKIGPDS